MGVDNDAIVDAAGRVAMVGIDCPLGWPAAVRRPADRRAGGCGAAGRRRGRCRETGPGVSAHRRRRARGDRPLAAECRRPAHRLPGHALRRVARRGCGSMDIRCAAAGSTRWLPRSIRPPRCARWHQSDGWLQDRPDQAGVAGRIPGGRHALAGLVVVRGRVRQGSRRAGRRGLRAGGRRRRAGPDRTARCRRCWPWPTRRAGFTCRTARSWPTRSERAERGVAAGDRVRVDNPGRRWTSVDNPVGAARVSPTVRRMTVLGGSGGWSRS